MTAVGARQMQDAMGKWQEVLKSGIPMAPYPLLQLDVSGNPLGEAGVVAICSGVMTSLPLLKTLVMRGVDLSTTGGCNAVAKMLIAHSCGVRSLDISSNPIGDVGIRILCGSLSAPPCHLESLHMDDVRMGAAGGEIFAELFQKVPLRLSELSIASNGIGLRAFSALCKVCVTDRSKLTALDASYNGIGESGTFAVREVVQMNPAGFHLQTLDLSGNGMGFRCIGALVDVLQAKGIRSLLLSSNEIGDRGAAVLASFVKSASTLQYLDLSANSIGDEGGRKLAEALVGTSLLKVVTAGNSMSRAVEGMFPLRDTTKFG